MLALDDDDHDDDDYHYIMLALCSGSLVQELFQLMQKRGRLTSAVLRLFLVPQLMELDLSLCPNQNLSSLDLHGCNEIPAAGLVELVMALPCLKKLRLSQTQCNTQVLTAVGSCCQQLCHLDIRECVGLSPDSLFYLTYDPFSQSFCSQSLEVLEAGPQPAGTNAQDVIWALVFVLLALPNLEGLFHNDIAEAMCLIYMQRFDNAWIPPGFPSLEDMTWAKSSNLPDQRRPRVMLGLKEITCLDEHSWPMAHAICPCLEKVSVTFTTRAILGLRFWTCCHLTHLTIGCRGRRDMRELLPVAANLRDHLQSFSISGFSFRDKLSFHVLLSHCLNLQKLSIHFRSPVMQGPRIEPKIAALSWDFSLPPHQFPRLCRFSLRHMDTMIPLPSQHIGLLKECLVSLLKHSPCLVNVELAGLPFALDEVLTDVLEPPGTALVHLCRLTLAENSVSLSTIRRLLSSDNELCYLELFLCSGIHWREYAELLQIVSNEGLKLDIKSSMPKRWEIPTLEKLALDTLAWDTPLTWIRDFRDGDLGMYHSFYVSPLFES
ncbi:hypothetical protein JD844_013506 [Phrynosoma platyrhinos]|uniref:Uncharacterized protein n=1 Tax=Phrynosoma platyrhinos TaxID=52577 RepID=A0ABQ7TKX7_PHRPL|nr:hypothetical protein JD844_013506 [Phrynosoma platyrhinos]